MILERPETAVPTQADAELASIASRMLASVRSKDGLRVRLDDGQELTLPRSATRLLAHLLTEMGQGNAVTLIPVHAELTTQQAADLLNISRPHLIKLLDEKKLPFHKVGTHRRVKFADSEAYKQRFEIARREALDALAAEAQELGMGY